MGTDDGDGEWRKEVIMVFDPRGIRQMDSQARPPDPLLAGIKKRSLPADLTQLADSFLVQFGASMGIKAVLAAGTDEAHVALDKVFHGFLQCLI